MPRVANKKGKKPLRGSVRQNTAAVADEEESSSWFSFELSFGMRLTLMVATALLIIGGTAILWRSGWPRRQYQNLIETSIDLTRKARFSVTKVNITPLLYTDKSMLLMALGVRSGSPIITFDPHEAMERVRQLPWVANVTIERQFPDTIFVQIEERKPMARWQRDNRVTVVDTTGQEISDAVPESFAYLPLVVGPDAPEKTEELLKFLEKFSFITQNMKAAVRVGERRWDLYLNPKIIIKLPEQNVVAALMRLEQMAREKKILDYEVATIDLRIADRIIVEPSGSENKDKDKESPPKDTSAAATDPKDTSAKALKKDDQKETRKKDPRPEGSKHP